MFNLHLIDLEYNLIDCISNLIRDLQTNKITLISSNRRPIRFIEQQLNTENLLKTDFFVLDEFVLDFVIKYTNKPLKIQTPLERYFLLVDILREDNELYQKLGGTTEKVFPWAKKVSALFDEIDKHRLAKNLQNFQYAELIEPAKAIAEKLKNLYQRYRKVIEEIDLTFGGDLYSRMLDILEETDNFLDFNNHAFIFTNLTYISETEADILNKLSKLSDTHFVIYHDLKERGKTFESFKAVDNLIKKLRRRINNIKIIEQVYDEPPKLPTLHFYSFPDTITEMNYISDLLNYKYSEIEDLNDPTQVAVVLPDENALLPLLINLPEDYDININITMGYPFKNTDFYRFISQFLELVIDLKESISNNTFRIKEEKILPICDYKDLFFDERIKAELEQLKNMILSPHYNPTKFTKDASPTLLQILDRFLNISSVGDLIDVFEYFISLIHRYPLEKEKEHIFKFNTINLFVSNFLDTLKKLPKEKELNIELAQILFEEISKDIAIPFEGSPLRGLQIMGILESRGLKFKNIFIPDMNEGVIPSVDKVDPLLSESIKRAIGLPSYEEKEILMRYNFYRLLFSSEQAHILYKTGSDGNNKSTRSRYVEQLILKEELEKKDCKNIVKQFHLDFYIPKIVDTQIEKPTDIPNIHSPSSLDTYLTCPYKYYLKYLKNIKPPIKIDREFEHDKAGSIVHAILKSTVEIGKTVEDSFDPDKAIKIIENVRNGLPSSTDLDKDSSLRNYIISMGELQFLMFVEILKHRLNVFLDKHRNLKEEYKVIATEKKIVSYDLLGILDRVDQVEFSKIRVVDYKTGSGATIPSKNKLTEVLAEIDNLDESKDALIFLKERIPSIQLIAYLMLVKAEYGAERYEARFFYLNKNRDNFPSFSPDENTDAIVSFLIGHLKNSKHIYPLPGRNCEYCDYNSMCRFAEQ